MGCNSSTPNSEPTSAAGGAAKGKNTLPEVAFEYFTGFGRGEPLEQMFVYHGQKFTKRDQDIAGGWEARKAAGDGGEFGGGLPQAFITDKGKSYRMAQFGAILRSFGIRYGYYNPRDWKACRYIDPVVDTFADVLGAQAMVAFAQDDEGRKAGMEKFLGVIVKFAKLLEANMAHHKGKFAAGNNITIADFVVAGLMQGVTRNKGSEYPFYAECVKLLPA